MSRTQEQLEARVRETPLVDRLHMANKMIGQMCSKGRPPKMTIPVQHDDEDFFIGVTLRDAIKEIQSLSGAGDAEFESVLCESCGQYSADFPAKICTGCEAYKEHQAI